MPRYFIQPYIRFTSKRIHLVSFEDKIDDEIPAKIAFSVVDKVRRIVAVGNDADGALAYGKEHNMNITVVEPFADSRTLINDTRAAGALISHSLGRFLVLSGRNLLFNRLLYRIRPVIHPLEKNLNDFTAKDAKQLILAISGKENYSLKLSKVFVWVGRELTFNEVESLTFPSEGKVFS